MKPSTQKLGLPVAIRCQSRVEPILASVGEFDRAKLGPNFSLKRIRSTFNPAGVCKYFVSSFSISDGSCERLTGFREKNYDDIRAKLKVDDRRLQSLINGESYGIGELELVRMLGLEYGRVGSGARHAPESRRKRSSPFRNLGQTSLDHLSRSRPGRAKRTLAMAFFGSMPRSTKSRAAIVPARPSPPRQWTNTSSLRRRIERNSSAATSQACSNFSLELTRQRLEDETTTYFGAIFPRRDLQPLSSITSSGCELAPKSGPF